MAFTGSYKYGHVFAFAFMGISICIFAYWQQTALQKMNRKFDEELEDELDKDSDEDGFSEFELIELVKGKNKYVKKRKRAIVITYIFGVAMILVGLMLMF